MKQQLIAAALAGIALAAQADEQSLHERASSRFDPLPESMPGSQNDTAAAIELGRDLYFEEKLSFNGTQSCNTCHRLDGGRAGVDNKPTSPGARGDVFGDRNSPTTLNAGLHVAQFWDGRAADLAEQAGGPILNPVEMGMPSEDEAVRRIRANADYRSAFSRVFGDQGVTYDNIAEAIAAFERTLITRDRFDDYLKGERAALSEREKRGLKTFLDVGCASCHSGALLGGNMYQKMGLVKPYSDREDTGRMAVTGKESDQYVFKVPSLRNVALTAPYFHDGAVETLEEAVRQMATLQLGRELGDAQVTDISAFLKTLSKKENQDLAQR